MKNPSVRYVLPLILGAGAVLIWNAEISAILSQGGTGGLALPLVLPFLVFVTRPHPEGGLAVIQDGTSLAFWMRTLGRGILLVGSALLVSAALYLISHLELVAGLWNFILIWAIVALAINLAPGPWKRKTAPECQIGLWGPPGSGKTSFLGLLLAEGLQEQRRIIGSGATEANFALKRILQGRWPDPTPSARIPETESLTLLDVPSHARYTGAQTRPFTVADFSGQVLAGLRFFGESPGTPESSAAAYLMSCNALLVLLPSAPVQTAETVNAFEALVKKLGQQSGRTMGRAIKTPIALCLTCSRSDADGRHARSEFEGGPWVPLVNILKERFAAFEFFCLPSVEPPVAVDKGQYPVGYILPVSWLLDHSTAVSPAKTERTTQ